MKWRLRLWCFFTFILWLLRGFCLALFLYLGTLSTSNFLRGDVKAVVHEGNDISIPYLTICNIGIHLSLKDVLNSMGNFPLCSQFLRGVYFSNTKGLNWINGNFSCFYRHNLPVKDEFRYLMNSCGTMRFQVDHTGPIDSVVFELDSSFLSMEYLLVFHHHEDIPATTYLLEQHNDEVAKHYIYSHDQGKKINIEVTWAEHHRLSRPGRYCSKAEPIWQCVENGDLLYNAESGPSCIPKVFLRSLKRKFPDYPDCRDTDKINAFVPNELYYESLPHYDIVSACTSFLRCVRREITLTPQVLNTFSIDITEVSIEFHHDKVTKTVEAYAVTWDKYLIEIGGYLGLMLGLSALTVVDALQFVSRRIREVARRCSTTCFSR